jgi:hypothetical protein
MARTFEISVQVDLPSKREFDDKELQLSKTLYFERM